MLISYETVKVKVKSRIKLLKATNTTEPGISNFISFSL